MSGDDLIETNFQVMQDIGVAIKTHFSQRICNLYYKSLDAMVWSLKKISGLKKNLIVGMAGILDSARFKYFLGKELNISFENIQTMSWVDMVILWYHY